MNKTTETFFLPRPDGGSIPAILNVREGQRRILLCLHGFAGGKDSSVIAALTKRLNGLGIGTVTFDWPAHGESTDPDEALTVENCLADLDTVVHWLKERYPLPLSCFATSYGGFLATLYRNEHPEVFEQLILRSPALRMSSIWRRLLTDEEFDRLMQEGTVIQGFERKMTLGKAFYDSLCRHDAFTGAPPQPERMLIIQGDRDDVVDPEDSRLYAEKNGIRIQIFEGTDHIYKKPGEKERIVACAEDFLLRGGNPEEIGG